MISRREFIWAGSGTLAASLLAPGVLAQEDMGEKKPNILLIVADDLGWRDLGCYGSEFYETPRIDRLVSEGLKFTDAYAASAVCAPTRASIMTGKYPARLHLTDIVQRLDAGEKRKLLVPDWTPYLPIDEVTIAEVLKRTGYRTGHVGKWHLGGFHGHDAAGNPKNQGFDVNIGGSGLGQPPDYFYPYERGDVRLKRMPKAPDGTYLTDQLTTEAIKFVRSSENRPFFLHLSYHSPHTSRGNRLQARAEVVEKYRRKKPVGGQDNPVYAAMLQHLDHNVGRMLDALRQSGLADNTIVIFVSDNGGHRGKTDHGPLRGAKDSSYEGGVRVPMAIRWPGTIPPNSVTDAVVTTPDLFPTICDMVGVQPKVPGKIDGESLVPLLTEGERPDREAIYWHFPHYSSNVPYGAVRAGRYKLIEFFESNRLELYDLKTDIGEQNDLSEKRPELKRKLHGMLRSWRDSVGAQMPPPNPRN